MLRRGDVQRVFLGGVAAVACAVALGADVATPEARWNAVVACASRGDERARHACVDDVLRQAGALTTEQESRDRRQRFGLDANAPAKTDSPAAAEPDTLELTIAKAVEGRDERLTITTQDGAVWRQTEDRAFAKMPQAGQTLTIHKATLGSFLCQVNGRSFRCSRSR